MVQWNKQGARRGDPPFRQALAMLYHALGLEQDTDDDELQYLSIDGYEIMLDQTENEDGLRITLPVGLLSGDRVRRLDQMRRILKRNLGQLRDFRTCCVLEETEDQGLLVLLQSVQPYAEIRAHELTERLSETVTLAGFYAEILSHPSDSGRAAEPAQETTQIIFRP